MVRTKDKDDVLLSEYLLDGRQMAQFFNVLKANVVRSRMSISAIFLTVYDQTIFEEEEIDRAQKEITVFLQHSIRQTDLLYKLSNQFEWCIFLAQSGEEEANAFLQRLFSIVKSKDNLIVGKDDISFSASIAEIANQNVNFEELIIKGKDALAYSIHKGAWQIESIVNFKERKVEKIKVSILEENNIFRHVLHSSLEDLSSNQYQLDIQSFQDGYEFLQSDWYSSGHTHIIIMNDILPRKNGLDVLHAIRKLPNNKRFIIFMMTKRKTEEDMIYAYETGVDEYLVLPFNLRLFEAQVKRTLERLWA